MSGTSRDPSSHVAELRRFFAVDWAKWLDQYPELSTFLGYPGRNDRWTDDSPEGIERRRRHLSESLEEVRRFDREGFPPAEQLNYDLYREVLELASEGLRYGGDPFPFRLGIPHNLWMPMNQMEGIHLLAGEIADVQPRQTLHDYDDLLARLGRLPAALEQNLALLEAGRTRGYTPSRVAVRGVPEQIRGLVPEKLDGSPLFRPFSEVPDRFSSTDRDRIVVEAGRLLSEKVAPVIRKLLAYYESEYLPSCRETVGLAALPNGSEAYSYLARWVTTTNLSPREIHEIGLQQVRTLRSAIEQQMARTGFSGTYREFCHFLQTDPRFFWATAAELVDGYRVIAKKVDPELGRLFGRLPRLPYGVLPVPQFREESSPTAYYQPGAPATGRAGIFYANTFEILARPKWEMEALTLHESVPGHHLQIAVAQELGELPEFRQHTGPTSYVEGWGLYAESLGEEVGCYEDPYSKVGQLDYDMWRSIRLVVDTGMHSMGWTRDRAIEFFRENSGKSDVDIGVEVDRYIVWPGQALGYKIGQLKFRELRTLAEKALGDRFDVRAFHDLVLAEGALPLGAVEARVRAWIASRA